MNILYVYADGENEFNCSKWNCIIPAKYVNKTNGNKANTIHINKWASNDEEALKLTKDSDIIVVERNYFGDILTAIQFWKVRNKTLIGIFDDAYLLMHPSNVSYDFWHNGIQPVLIKNKDGTEKTQMAKIIPHPATQFKWGIQLFKGIQVPSVMLAKDWYPYNNTYYIKNYLDLEKYENVGIMHPHSDKEILIGWHGSMSHYHSFVDSGLLDALRKIEKEYPNVKVLIGGDKRIFDELKIKNKIYQPFVSEEEFLSVINSLDIGLAPLSGEYDKRRSWIKPLEYMILKKPWIATDYITYSDLKPYGVLTENGYSNWVKALREVIDNIDDYKEKAQKEPYEFALKQSSEENVKKVILPFYEKMIEKEYPIMTREGTENNGDLSI